MEMGQNQGVFVSETLLFDGERVGSEKMVLTSPDGAQTQWAHARDIEAVSTRTCRANVHTPPPTAAHISRPCRQFCRASTLTLNDAATSTHPRWMHILDGIPEVLSPFLSAMDHLALSSCCTTLRARWLSQGGLAALSIYLDKFAVDTVARFPSNVICGGERRWPLSASRSSEAEGMEVDGVAGIARGGVSQQGGSVVETVSLSALSRLLERCPRLRKLQFRGSLSQALESPLESAIRHACVTANIHLQSLILSRLNLTPHNALTIARALQSPACSTLETLDLSHNTLRCDGIAIILSGFACGGVRQQRCVRVGRTTTTTTNRRTSTTTPPTHRLTQLRTLDLSSNQMGAKGLREVRSALLAGVMSRLSTLRLTGNNIKEDGGAVLASIIEAKHVRGLETLDVAGCGLGCMASRKLLMAASDDGLSSLTTLNIGSNYFDATGVGALASALASGRLSALTHLQLDLSGIDDHSAMALMRALSNPSCCPQLKRLDLARNTSLNGQAWQEIMAGPGLPASIQDVNLANCTRLGPEGVMGLSAWIHSLPPHTPCLLRLLDLTNTGLGAVGVQHLSAAIMSGRLFRLQAVVLRNNRVGHEGAVTLCDALIHTRVHCALTSLDLSENALGNDGVAELVRAVKSGALSALQTLHLSDNQLYGTPITPLRPASRIVGTRTVTSTIPRPPVTARSNSQAWQDLAVALHDHCPMLVELDVSKNPLGCGGGGAFVPVHLYRPLVRRLKVLRLAWTELDATDVENLVCMLEGDGSMGSRSHRSVCAGGGGGCAGGDDADVARRHTASTMGSTMPSTSSSTMSTVTTHTPEPRTSSTFSSSPPPLCTLDLAYNTIGRTAASRVLRLAFSGRTPSLHTLSLVGTSMTDQEAREIAQMVLACGAHTPMCDVHSDAHTAVCSTHTAVCDSDTAVQGGQTSACGHDIEVLGVHSVDACVGAWWPARLECVDLRGNELSADGKKVLQAAMADARAAMAQQGLCGRGRRTACLFRMTV